MTPRAGLVALVVTIAAYLVIAWLVSAIEIPPDVPSARVPWMVPSRVATTLGFAIARLLRVAHTAGQMLAAIAIGGVLGAVFAITRLWARG
jgi:hypothetical protein